MCVLLRNIKLGTSPTFRKIEILIRDGKIAATGDALPVPPDTRVIDGKGLTVLPAFVDLHAHFRDPGFPQKEDIETGCKAAVKGGYTTVNLMPNTDPVCSSMEVARYVTEKAKKTGLCDVFQTVSITKDFDGFTTAHIHDLNESVRFLSEDGFGVNSTKAMLDGMILAKSKGMGVMLHEEDAALTRIDSYAAEEIMTARDVRLASLTGCKTHFCHVSTIGAMDSIITGKLACGNITCEVTPHHLALNDTTNYRVAPPLRGEAHRRYLIDCLKNGLIDAIATDHAPHTPGDKQNGANGITGLDLSFPVCYTALVQTGELTLSQLAAAMSENPAKILGLGSQKGKIEPGFDADLVLLDLSAEYTVTPERLASKSKNTPFIGEALCGEVVLTIKQGEIVYEKTD